MTQLDLEEFNDSGIECPACGKEQVNYQGYGLHWRNCGPDKHALIALVDEDWFRKMYRGYGGELEQFLPCDDNTVVRAAESLGIKKAHGGEPPNSVSLNVTLQGHVNWTHKGECVNVHQVLAIANGEPPEKVFGCGRQYQVHHKNGIPWDNRHDNIELLHASEHGARHGREGEIIPPEDQNDLTPWLQ